MVCWTKSLWSPSANSAAHPNAESARPVQYSTDGRDHWPYCYTAVVAGAGVKRGYVHGKSDKTASAPAEDPVHPIELLASIYHGFGIDPATVYNHLNRAMRIGQGAKR
ncbi:MAG: DUF1501 domain-containing protein [Pirellulaceae bacterium]